MIIVLFNVFRVGIYVMELELFVCLEGYVIFRNLGEDICVYMVILFLKIMWLI